MATFYLDPVDGNDANDGTTFANRWKTLTSGATAARIAPGDTIRFIASPDPTSLGQDVTWTSGSSTLTLTTAVTATIDECDSAWTASANITGSTTATYRRTGTNCVQLAPAAAFTTGKVAYKALGASTDLSAYEQVTLWVRAASAIAAGVYELRLCSDTTGDAAVNTLALPALMGSAWNAIVLNNAAALGSAIQSVALYAASDPGTTTVHLDHILACKAASAADCLTLQSLVSRANDGTEPWFPVLSITGTTLVLDASYDSIGPVALTYYGPAGAATTYVRPALMLEAASTMTVQDDGTEAAPIVLSGGWNRTDMSTQTGETWIGHYGCNNANNRGHIDISTRDWIDVDKLYALRGAGLVASSTVVGLRVRSYAAAGSYHGLHLNSMQGVEIDHVRSITGAYYAINVERVQGLRIHRIDTLLGNYIAIRYSSPTRNTQIHAGAGAGIVRGSITYGVYHDAAARGHAAYGLTFSNNGSADIALTTGSMDACLYRLYGCALNSTTPVSDSGALYSHDHGGVAGTHYIRAPYSAGTIQTATDQRHTASGVAWKFNPTSTAYANSLDPLALSVAKIACAANEARTVTLWARRSNTGLNLRLRVQENHLIGLTADVIDTMSVAADTWEQLSITFTPTVAAVVEVFAEAWGGTTYSGWIDDLGVT